MPASPQDKFKKVGANTVTSLAAPGKNLGATSINVGSTTNYPTDTGLVIGIRIVDSNGNAMPGTYTEWNGMYDSPTSLTIENTPVYGTDQVYGAGATTQVFLMVSSSLHNQMVDGLLVSHDQDGKLKANAPIDSPQGSLANITPIGSILNFAGSTAPTGWLLCYGQVVSRATYASLFAVISTTYGAGDGSTTFNLPDLRGRTVAGKDDMGGSSANRLTGLSGGLDGDVLGASGGAQSHTLSQTEIPSHSHTVGLGGANTNFIPQAGVGIGTTATTSNTGLTGGGGAHNNVQPTIIMNHIIKT